MSVDSREDHLGQRSWIPAHAGTQLTLGACRLSFAGPVTGARCLNPIPSRTRPLNASALMVLCLKTRESRSSPGQPRTIPSLRNETDLQRLNDRCGGGARVQQQVVTPDVREPTLPRVITQGVE